MSKILVSTLYSSVTSAPLISAVICTYNRSDYLEQALESLCHQTLDKARFEVIVIDDGSVDDTQSVIESFTRRLALHSAYQRNSGLASAKNHGLFLARSPLVAFLDDDDVLDARCLEEHCLAHQRYPDPQFAVLGHTDLAEGPRQSQLMQYVTAIGQHLFCYPSLQPDAQLDYTFFWGGRSSCKRAFLLEHGVFNPVFRFGAEDIELGYRLSRVGLKVIYNAKAISRMLRTLTLDDFCRRCYLQGRSNWVFSTLHDSPEIRQWAQTDGIEAEWALIAPRYDEILASARGLDRLAHERARVGLQLDPLTTRLLHRAYEMSFRASRIKGSIERMNEPVDDHRHWSAEAPEDRAEGTETITVVDPAATLEMHTLSDQASLHALRHTRSSAIEHQRLVEDRLLQDPFATDIAGYCWVCQQPTRLAIDYSSAYRVQGKLTPNWRETLTCACCGLHNRMRAAIQLIETELRPAPHADIYLTEQTTAVFAHLKRRYPNVIGSEFLGDEREPGWVSAAGIRHEDITRLSFKRAAFDVILSFDVIEHLPDHQPALAEFARILRPGGCLLLSAPFIADRAETLVRARLSENGQIHHLAPPEYHGDPLRSEGCLCYRHFGWDLLGEISAAGFTQVSALHYWSRTLGYLGADQMMIRAIRQ